MELPQAKWSRCEYQTTAAGRKMVEVLRREMLLPFVLYGDSGTNNPTLIRLSLGLSFICSVCVKLIITGMAGKWRSDFILACNVIKMTHKS